MASMTIRNLDEPLKARLRIRAAQHGKSMEDEARDILRSALATEASAAMGLASEIRERFASFTGPALEPLPREPVREPPDFSE